MTLDLGKLIAAHRFKWTTESLDNVLVHDLTVSANSILNKKYKNYLEADSRILITTVCQLDSKNTGEYTDDRVSYEQSRVLSND